MLDFSDSDKKIRIVFAAEDDRYYTDSLLKLDLNQYLWMSLRKYYDNVWFVSVNKRGDINVKCFENNVSVVKKQSSPSKWLIEQASRDRKQAFVVKKDSFKALFEQRNFWGETSFIDISKFQNIMVIVIVPPKIYEVKDLLSGDYPVIKPYAERIIQSEKKDIIFVLYSKYNKYCSFLPSFTKECIRNLLLYTMFRDTEKADSAVFMEYMAVYLAEYMNNKAMQWKFDLSLFENEQFRKFPLHRKIQEKLSDMGIWKKLEGCARKLYDIDCNDADNALKIYLDECGLSERSNDIIFMSPEELGPQSNYLNADPCIGKIKPDVIPESIKKYVFDSYNRLNYLVMTSGICEEKSECVGELENLIDSFWDIRENTSTNSRYEKYFRCLICIEKCVWLVYQSDEDGVRSNINIEIIKKYWQVVNDFFEQIYVWDTEKYGNAYKVLSKVDEAFCLEKSIGVMNDSIENCRRIIKSMSLPSGNWGNTVFKTLQS